MEVFFLNGRNIVCHEEACMQLQLKHLKTGAQWKLRPLPVELMRVLFNLYIQQTRKRFPDPVRHNDPTSRIEAVLLPLYTYFEVKQHSLAESMLFQEKRS